MNLNDIDTDLLFSDDIDNHILNEIKENLYDTLSILDNKLKLGLPLGEYDTHFAYFNALNVAFSLVNDLYKE